MFNICCQKHSSDGCPSLGPPACSRISWAGRTLSLISLGTQELNLLSLLFPLPGAEATPCPGASFSLIFYPQELDGFQQQAAAVLGQDGQSCPLDAGSWPQAGQGGQSCPLGAVLVALPRRRLLVAPLPAGTFGGGSSIQPIVIQSAGAFLGEFLLLHQHFPAMGPPTPPGAQPDVTPQQPCGAAVLMCRPCSKSKMAND